MRSIRLFPVIIFSAISLLSFVLSLGFSILVNPYIILGEFNSIVKIIFFIIVFYGFIFFFYRLFLGRFPIKEGEILENSFAEKVYQTHLLFYLMLFYPLIRSRFIPLTLNRLIYLLLGAKFGKETYVSGVVLDPSLTYIGDYTLLGQDSVIYAHAIEGKSLSHSYIRIGNYVTIGANSVILPGVTIADHAIVAAGAVVKKGTTIGHGEIWGGVPAKKIGSINK